MPGLGIGSITQAKGCVTRLIDVNNRSQQELEDRVGFRRGRLAKGYYILVLKERLTPEDIQFFGYTYMSGGKHGLPSNDPAVERGRKSAEQALIEQLGQQGLKSLKAMRAREHQLSGSERLVKIIPEIRHDELMGPADQYPAAPGGIMQLNLVRPKAFLVAAHVDPDNTFDIGSARIAILPGVPYENRRKVAAYLETV